MDVKDARVGITTTLPIEVILAAGRRPVDLNTLFIGANEPGAAVQRAELDGFPRNSCSWIKGIYSTVRAAGIPTVVAVTGGDCSNTVALKETLEDTGVEVITFEFPRLPDRRKLKAEVRRLQETLGAEPGAPEATYESLRPVRRDLAEVDRLTWDGRKVTGAENFAFLLAASDMGGDVQGFGERVRVFLDEARRRPPWPARVRLALLGVPPIISGLFDLLAAFGAEVVFNEIPRQFALIAGSSGFLDAYLTYTYPYGIWARLNDIKTQIAKRRVEGAIHYVQSFCYRQIEGIILKKHLGVPVLTLEGDRPGPVSAQNELRIECFMEMLRKLL